ncbi:LysR family transcriptional regulator [Rubrivivax gelatinosus]|uniref:LysR family transcriptional regulator n=1 Tax=Rubrivivax gelatinosus TaxID=28068 RepID=A0A4R2MBB9_RUBGE|nr:LysR family transcriptional regulator [Rubrivivax gelatinosus]MBK1689070.1 LysR family transcriptional regulator [Rubrivivax gelatinosus]TCP03571.1 LysR family transcriptional regulator [Rubrivivax gelatinosus]
MKIDFDGVQAFVVVAELGGFNKAARELHVTQTALTRRVQKLEAYLGLKLLDRTTRRVDLTAVGREFLPQARAIVQEMTAAVEQLKDMSRRSTGHFTLACIPSMSSHLLPRVMRRYAELYPGNRIRLLDGSSHEVRNAVLGGQAELGIAVHGEKHPDLAETVLFADALVLLCRSPHALEAREAVTWSDLRDTELIGISSFTATRVFMDYQLAKQGIRLQGNYEVQHHATAINLVAAGVGCAILPSSAFEEGDRPGVRKIALTQPTVKRKVSLLRTRHGGLSPAAQAFHDLLRETPLG